MRSEGAAEAPSYYKDNRGTVFLVTSKMIKALKNKIHWSVNVGRMDFFFTSIFLLE